MVGRGTIDDALFRLARDESGRVLAVLARRFNDLDLADEAVQEALIEAADRWPTSGVPDNPGGWLYRIANRKAIDRLRRSDSARRRLERSARELAEGPATDHPSTTTDMLIHDVSDSPIDERLRLILLCCHPALHPDAQVALTLRLVAGLTAEEIGAAFLVPTPTLAARITRAKKKIRQAHIPLTVPERLDERLAVVLRVIYLLFNEGYLTRSGGGTGLRVDLCTEAVRLSNVVVELAPDHAEALGLSALLRFNDARRDARFRGDELVPLDEQDRGAWHLDEIRSANQLLASAMRLMQPGPLQIEALIASHHANAPTAADTDWSQIVSLYDQIVAMRPSPVVALNRAVAVAMADGPLAGLRAVDAIDGLDDYHLYHATRGELEARCGNGDAARAAFERAREMVRNESERTLLTARLDEIL